MDDQAVPCLGGRHLAGQPRGRLTLGVHREHLLFADAGGADLIGPLRIDDDVAGTARRFASGQDNRLVIAPSTLDIDLSITSARSRLNMANIIDTASQHNVRVLVVGPPPTLDAERNRRIADLSAAYADVTTRRNHVYVDTFNPLQHHEQWRKDLAANHGRPGQAGYGLMAWLVLHRGWYGWLDLPEPQ